VIHRIQITNFMGIAAREIEFSPEGAVIEGGNGKGKTSVLKAIRAALSAQGVSADAIRKGADATEILIAIDDITVRRAITARGGKSLTVTLPNGERRSSPQEFLSELLGLAPLDPIDLFFERDAKKRRARILAALPVAVTAELLQKWLPPGEDAAKLLGPDGLVGHGLEVIERARQILHNNRHGANAEVKALEGEQVLALAKQANAQAVVESLVAQLGDLQGSPEEAEALVASAREGLAALLDADRAAENAESRNRETSDRCVRLHSEAEEERRAARARMPTPQAIEEAENGIKIAAEAHAAIRAEIVNAEEAIAQLQAELAKAKKQEVAAYGEVDACTRFLETLKRDRAAAEQQKVKADELDARAKELAAAVGLDAARPAPADITQAREAVAKAECIRDLATARASLAAAAAAGEAAREKTSAAKAKAEALDISVRALREEAPRTLLQASNAIEGLALDGDEVMIDGVSLDRISGAEQLHFATEIARRLNAKARLLIVDGLERLDAEQLPNFVKMATAGGYQLISTRVTSGDAVVHPIEKAER
jgi:DNA repair exonuclease SbcCD ATPase subunit